MEILSASLGSGNHSWPDLANLDVALGSDRAAEAGPASLPEGVQPASSARCPQGQDCPAVDLVSRIFACQEGCGFMGCAACMEIHEAEPHASDSLNSLEMSRNCGSSW